MSKLIKQDLIEILNSNIGISKTEAKQIVDTYFSSLICLLKTNKHVNIQNVGYLTVEQHSKNKFLFKQTLD